jgi:large subunit ribosomal protein L15
MRLNELSPALGSRTAAKRVGRGVGSGLGKTAGRGHKGARARAGGNVRSGFEGGQMPLQMRLPKFGFKSRISGRTAEIRLGELNRLAEGDVDLQVLKDANLVQKSIARARIIASGSIARKFAVKGLAVTKGARAAILDAGGSIED